MARATTFRVSNGLAPDEGLYPVAMPVLAQLASAASVTVNLLVEEDTGAIDQIQTVFIDNADNASKVTLTCGTSGQRIVCPPGAQGYFAIAAADFNFTVATAGAVNVPLTFFNVPLPGHVWSVS